MNRHLSICHLWILLGATIAFMPHLAIAERLSKPALMQLQFEQKLNAQLPLDLSFTNDAGVPVRLGDYFGKQPVILVLGYYACPMLCSLVLNGVVESLQDMRWSAGKHFQVVFVSIDPRETPALAAAKKRTYLRRYARPGAEEGWHFLVGQEAQIKALANTVGFQFAYDTSLKQYAHPSGVVVVTPEGKVARYLFGVSYPATELNAALKSAAAHKVGSPVQELLILCFQHMPLFGENSAAIMRGVRALAVATALGVAAYIAVAIRREKKRQPGQPQPESVPNP